MNDHQNPIAAYAATQEPALGAICDHLQDEIDSAIPTASSKIWHGSPVWFIGENPIVGYSVRAKRVDLMFWSGQLFDEPLLKPVGKDKAAQIGIGDKSGIDFTELARWLEKARTVIFDYAGMYARKRTAARPKP
jgi:hypothetical protein